jgi:hypothetical protein
MDQVKLGEACTMGKGGENAYFFFGKYEGKNQLGKPRCK